MQPALAQTRTHANVTFPWPEDGETITTACPGLRWIPVDGGAPYTVIIERLADQHQVVSREIASNLLLLREPLEPGTYRWDLRSAGLGAARGWQTFIVPADADREPVPTAATVLAALPGDRPRHLFRARALEAIRQRHPRQIEILRRNIAQAISDGTPPPPRYHRDPTATPYREAFGRHRAFVDRNLIACAWGHLLLGDAGAAAQVRDTVLTICDWNPDGPCSVLGPWGDEFGLSHARCLPAVFDWCHDLFDAKERDLIARTIAHYARQMEERLRGIDFPANPGNSHAGRLPAYLGETALVLHGTAAADPGTCERWLSYALEIYGAAFPFYGGRDGGWAEGPFYASSYTKWYQPFFQAIEQICGYSFFERPFYRQVSQFFLHCAQPHWECRPFGDGNWCGPDDPEWPGFCAQDPFGLYAERFGPEEARALAATIRPQHYELHLLDVVRPAFTRRRREDAGPARNSRHFRDAGYLSFHRHINRTAGDVALIALASRHGSGSHRHADQGNVALLADGHLLIGPTGTFGRQYGTAHHRGWTQQSQAHNVILVDGEGQPYGNPRACGRVTAFHDDGATIDLAACYPRLRHYERSLRFDRDRLTVEITDRITADTPVAIAWLLHTWSPPEVVDGQVLVRRGGWTARIEVAAEGAETGPVQINDRFAIDVNAGEPTAWRVERPDRHHLRWDLAPATALTIRARIVLIEPESG